MKKYYLMLFLIIIITIFFGCNDYVTVSEFDKAMIKLPDGTSITVDVNLYQIHTTDVTIYTESGEMYKTSQENVLFYKEAENETTKETDVQQ